MDVDRCAPSGTPSRAGSTPRATGCRPRPAWDELQQALEVWRHGSDSWEPWGESTERARRAFARLVQVEPTGSRSAAPCPSRSAWSRRRCRTARGSSSRRSSSPRTCSRGWCRRTAASRSSRSPPTGCSMRSPRAHAGGDQPGAVGRPVRSRRWTTIVAAARAVDALVAVDGSQAVGWLPADASQVDAFVCIGYKWLMSPRGTVFLALSERLQRAAPADQRRLVRRRRRPHVVLRAAAAARDRRPPVRRLAGVVQLGGHSAGPRAAGADRHRADPGVRRGAGRPVPCRPRSAARRDGHRVDDGRGCPGKLERAGIRAATRAGALRASFHLYSTEADVDAALDALVG